MRQTACYGRPAGDRFADDMVRLNLSTSAHGGTTVDGPLASNGSDGLVAAAGGDGALIALSRVLLDGSRAAGPGGWRPAARW
ncbi:MAG: hypothetical protein IRZ07_09120 [Microbispora sp.]|nr:hypothetical protein [Microbispora sp.]